MKNSSIYALLDPRNEEIRYVGKTEGVLTHRLSVHISDAKCGRDKCHRANWIRSLLRQDLKPSIQLIEEVPDEDWQWYETWWIVYGRVIGWNLTNSTLGGEGISGWKHSDEVRQKISEDKKGKYVGESNPFFGKTHSEEFKHKMSGVKKGSVVSEETRRKMSKSHKGMTHTEETRYKISVAKKGNRYSQGERNRTAKIRETDAQEIKKQLSLNVSYAVLAEQFGVSKGIIGHIKTGVTWKHVR